LTHIAINIADQQSILNLFWPSIWVVFNVADGMWMMETMLLYILYFGRVYITFRPSEEFSLGLGTKCLFAVLIVLNLAANVGYFLTAFGFVKFPMILPSTKEGTAAKMGAADMFVVTVILDFLINAVLLSLFLSKLRVLQRRSSSAIHGKESMLSAMTKVTVLGIVAMTSTQLIYVYALIMFNHLGENETTYEIFYALRDANILFDVVAVYCNLGELGSKLYRILFWRCHLCVFSCCKKVTVKERMAKGIQLNAGGRSPTSKEMHPVDNRSDECNDDVDSESPRSTSGFQMD